jgi:peptide/nickel transport system ATP-binding protein
MTVSARQPVLEIQNLTVALPSGSDRPYAVHDLSLSLARGEILCIVGESGSGKSITAQAIMGLLPQGLDASGGSALFSGKDLLQLKTRDRLDITGREIAMIFQEPTAALNPVFRVGDIVAEAFRVHTDLKPAEVRRKVLDLLKEVRLPDPERIYNNYPHQLSGGQCQRVMIATALALNPSVLIADEPTTALDVTTQAQILKLILELREHHDTGVIFITHDFGVVAEIADRVAVMQHGRLVEIGTRDEILNHPREPYTKALIAAVPTLGTGPGREFKGPPILDAREIRKTFATSGSFFRRGRTVAAVNNVDLTLHGGETLGLVGESGSGKSTLAQCVIRLQEPTSGTIQIGGVDFASLNTRALREARKRVQIIFQDPYTTLDPRQRVGDAIAEGPIIHGMGRREAVERAKKLIQEVGLEPQAAVRYPHEFSGGQRQRLSIARALAVEPKLLIADESVSALDVSVQAQILELLSTMQARLGFAMLFITHDLRVASRICDRIAVMQHGRIVEEGRPAELFSNPRNPYTCDLLAAVPGRDWHKPVFLDPASIAKELSL